MEYDDYIDPQFEITKFIKISGYYGFNFIGFVKYLANARQIR